MIGVNKLQKIVKACLLCFMAGLLVLNITSCGESKIGSDHIPTATGANRNTASAQAGNISEVSPPATIQQLGQDLDYQPQVKILSPQPDEVLQDDTVTARFQVQDLPIFKNPQLDSGLHLDVILDNQPSVPIYDLNQPLVLPNLTPGTHTLRVFASRPWEESFKNDGAYAQTTFHIFTKTDDNNPSPTQPLLTYNSPQGSYGAEPILLDFYLTNAPLHLVAQENRQDEIADWRIRCTINGNSFVIDHWESIYLKGFKPGKNWVQLEFLNEQGDPVKNVFNNTVRVITYDPKGKDTLSKLIKGELSADAARGMIDPNYTPTTQTRNTLPTPTEPTETETKPTLPTPIPTPSAEETSPTEPIEEKPVETENQPQDLDSTNREQSKQTENQPKGFFNRFRRSNPQPSPIPKVISPEPESISPDGSVPLEEIPEPQPSTTPVEPVPSAKPDSQVKLPAEKSEDYFNPPNAQPSTIPDVLESPEIETIPDKNDSPPQTEELPPQTPTQPNPVAKPESKYFKLPPKERLGGYFNRFVRPEVSPSPDLPPTLPEIVEPNGAVQPEGLSQ